MTTPIYDTTAYSKLDSYWKAMVDFIQARFKSGDHLIAPSSIADFFSHGICESYDDQLAGKYQWVVLYKGALREAEESGLITTCFPMDPVFANEVSVVFAVKGRVETLPVSNIHYDTFLLMLEKILPESFSRMPAPPIPFRQFGLNISRSLPAQSSPLPRALRDGAAAIGLDPISEAVADFLGPHLAIEDRLVAPFDLSVSYRDKGCQPIEGMLSGDYQWIVLGKELLREAEAAGLITACFIMAPVFANEAFVVFGRNAGLKPLPAGYRIMRAFLRGLRLSALPGKHTRA